MTFINNSQKKNFPRNGQNHNKTGVRTFILRLKQKLVNLIGIKDKDGSPDKIPGAGTPFWQGNKKPGRPHTNGDMGTPLWWGMKKDEHPEVKTPGAGTFIIWIKEKFVNLIGTKDKDGSPDKTPGAGTPFWQGDKKPDPSHINGDTVATFWWGTNKDGRPRKTTDAGTP